MWETGDEEFIYYQHHHREQQDSQGSPVSILGEAKWNHGHCILASERIVLEPWPCISCGMIHVTSFFSQLLVSSFIMMRGYSTWLLFQHKGGLLNIEKNKTTEDILRAVMVHAVYNYLACLSQCTQKGGLHPLDRLISTCGNTSVRLVTPINRGTLGRSGITWCGSCRHPRTLLLSVDARIKDVTCILVFEQDMSSLEYLLHWRARQHLPHPNENPGHSHGSVSELL